MGDSCRSHAPRGSASQGVPRRVRLFRYIFLLVLMPMFFAGCSGDPGTGPAEVRWDRHACERCRMVLSDRKHSAQIRYAKGERSEVKFFDDIGCAVIWLEEQPFADLPTTEIWVTDWRGGEWIDAAKATYVKGQVTPMEYGLGAQNESAPSGIDFTQAKAHILEVERRFNTHGGDLHQHEHR